MNFGAPRAATPMLGRAARPTRGAPAARANKKKKKTPKNTPRLLQQPRHNLEGGGEGKRQRRNFPRGGTQAGGQGWGPRNGPGRPPAGPATEGPLRPLRAGPSRAASAAPRGSSGPAGRRVRPRAGASRRPRSPPPASPQSFLPGRRGRTSGTRRASSRRRGAPQGRAGPATMSRRPGAAACLPARPPA